MAEYILRSDMRAVLELASINPRFADEPLAADVAPVVHGRWVKVKPVHYQCCVCGINTGGFTSNYCPGCGAKMYKEAVE